MKRALMQVAVSTILAASLTACGGGGTGGGAVGVASTPPPPPPPPVAQPPFGVTADTQFVTVGDDVEFRWIDSANAYEIQFPGQPSDRLAFEHSSSTSENHRGPSGYYISLSKNLPYQYTNVAYHLDRQFGDVVGEFAYGIPTAGGDVPLTGSASYSAKIAGGSGYGVDGEAKLSFNFGAGSLTGYMHPILSDAWFTYDYGQYNFTQTVYSTGSTSFSGKFIVPDGGSTADSGFNGRFTGPDAAELMAEWHAPFRDPYSLQWINISGLWIGKKD